MIDVSAHVFTVDERATAHAAFSWLLSGNPELSMARLKTLPPDALRDVALTAEMLAGAALKFAGVADSLEALPDGVEGQRIGGRS